MLSWIRWQWSKRRFAFRTGSAPNVVSHLLANHDNVEKYAPNALPYERLSEHWNDLAPLMGYGYASFLAKLEARYQVAIGSVLDIACGTGVDARAMAKAGRTVVGLDVSPGMIAHARATSLETSVEYAQGDMRDFSLGRTFAAATCGGNSLNYVETPGQIVDVMRCVARHLKPGGFFLLDANDGNCFWWSGIYANIYEFAGHRVDRLSFYDPNTRIEESRVVIGNTIERHRRIPIEIHDVTRAAAAAGLKVLERFSRKLFALIRIPGPDFYILRKP